jgi:hypothetical protein
VLRCCTFALAVTLLGACYSPQLRDCAITCGGGTCPVGLSCEAGYCRVANFEGSCSSDGSVTDTRPDDDAALTDGPSPDLICSHTCYTPASGGGGASNIGTAGCLTGTTNGCGATEQWIETTDLCPCSAGFPILYVRKAGTGVANVAFVGPVFAGQSWRLRVNDSNCLAPEPSTCPVVATADCGQNALVWTWTGIVVTPGVFNSFDLYFDDGTSACTNTPFSEFAVQL